MNSTRAFLAGISYWALFIIAPTWFCAFAINKALGIGVFFVSVLIGEHAFRPWKHLWRVKDDLP